MDHSATPVGRRKGSVSALSNELFKHRRQSSSLSTSASASVSSNRTRVLPFATARTLQPISAASAVHAQGTTTQVLTGARSRATTTIGGSDTPSKTSAGRGDSAPARAKAMTLPYDSDSRGDAGDLKSPPVIAIGAVARSTATGQVYFPAAGHPGFALAQPRRVITVNGAPLSEALFAGRQNNGAARAGNVRSATTRQPSKSHLQSLAAPAATNESQSTCGRRGVAGSIGLSSIKPSADSRRVASSGAGSSAGGHSSGARTKPIIGLGLTLNPADAVVTLQPKRSTQLRSRPIAASGAVFATAGSRRQTAAIGRIQRQQVVQRHGQASALAQSRASAAVAKSLAAALPSSNRSSVASPPSTGSANSGNGSVDGGMRGGEFTFKSPLLESCISLNDLAGSPFPEDPKLVMLNSSKRETSKGFLEMTELRTVPDAASHGAESPSAQPLPSVEGISAGAASAAAAVQMDEVVPSMDDLRDFVSCASPATTADAANDASETSASTADAKSTLRSCQEPRVATCVLCFEQVLISKKRGHVMRCPSCSSQISEQPDKPPKPRAVVQRLCYQFNLPPE
ncbi:hypothetical protein GQ54DRAFT_194646 [Martensiomyces pterosporus]|nr:hypothetical protein GQ54DRAFT_194646 [Martensiomyces pterosporus]